MAFPEGFLWGTASSATQSEGSAPASDWRAWERDGRAPASGDGNGFAARFADDFAILAEHGLTHHRLSIDWARIEPENGRRDPAAIEHYREVLRTARELGISVWVCLHHFTLPGWFSHDERGFVEERSRSYFWPRHVDFVAETFGDLVVGWMPVNEPVAYASLGWLDGSFPPGRRDPAKFAEALEATHLANLAAWRRLRGAGQPVATVHNLSPVFPVDGSAEAASTTRVVDDAIWRSWISMLRDGVLQVPGRGPVEVPDAREAFDLIGFSYYNASAVRGDGTFAPYPAGAAVGPLGYAPWAEGLGIVLHRLAEDLPDRPLLVAECGVGTTDDSWRESVLRDSLAEVERAVDDGIDVRGLFHWTGVDNYEWLHGFTAPFGIIDHDRSPKPSAALLASYARGAAPTT